MLQGDQYGSRIQRGIPLLFRREIWRLMPSDHVTIICIGIIVMRGGIFSYSTDDNDVTQKRAIKLQALNVRCQAEINKKKR